MATSRNVDFLLKERKKGLAPHREKKYFLNLKSKVYPLIFFILLVLQQCLRSRLQDSTVLSAVKAQNKTKVVLAYQFMIMVLIPQIIVSKGTLLFQGINPSPFFLCFWERNFLFKFASLKLSPYSEFPTLVLGHKMSLWIHILFSQ